MTLSKCLVLASVTVLFIGCADRKQVYESVYNGLTGVTTMKQDPAKADPPYDRPMSYKQYEVERERILKREKDSASPD